MNQLFHRPVLAVAFLAAALFSCGPVNGRIYQTDDAIIVEADSTQRRDRSTSDPAKAKFPFPYPFSPPIAFPTNNFEGSPSSSIPSATYPLAERSCWTTEGEIGSCTSVRTCYPKFKLPELTNLETWVIGTRGTCHYVEPDGRQVYGVCCPRGPISNSGIAVGSLAGTIPTVPIDPTTGLPEANFPWWLYYPFRPANATTTTTTTTTTTSTTTTTTTTTTTPPPSQSVFSEGKASCGAGPFKALSIDEQKRIVGGTDAVKNSWPFIVALLNNDRQFCGGSLMDSTHVLTAAHCIAHMSSWDVSRLEVALGMHVLKPSKDPQLRKKVRRVTRHKLFDSRTLYNDIALLTLESPIFFTPTISPVCLPPLVSSEEYVGQEAAVVGWGALKEGGSQPSVLQQVTVQIMTNSKCKSDYGSDAPGGIVDHMLCAAYPGKDSCSGDSGGPLLVQSSPGSPWVQVGIVSWGIGCAQVKYPGVYARVTSFMGWIEKNSR